MGDFGIFGVLFDGRSVQQEVQERVGLDTGSGESERPCRRESGVGGSGGGCVEATCPASVTSRGLPWRSYRGVH